MCNKPLDGRFHAHPIKAGSNASKSFQDNGVAANGTRMAFLQDSRNDGKAGGYD